MHRLVRALTAAMSTIALTQIASAADLPMKAPPVPAVAPVLNWTGFYVGANVGGGWGNRDVDVAPNDPIAVLFRAFAVSNVANWPSTSSFDTSGAVGGLQLGYNWQFHRNWLIGLETDFDWSGMKGSASSAAFFDEKIKWFGTVRARLGYLPTDNLLAFITGGFAYGRVEHTASNGLPAGVGIGIFGADFHVNCVGPATCFAGTSSDMATGWTVGGGLEYAIWQRWTVRAEYLYVSLESQSVTETAFRFPAATTSPSSFNANFSRTNFNVARVGANYRF